MNQTARPTWTRYKVLLFLCVSASLAYICRNSISVAESSIRADLDLTKRETGWMMALFFLPYALAQIPSGWLSHRRGTRVCLPAFAVLWSAATFLMGKANGLMLLAGARIGQGISQAGIFPASTNTIAKWFPTTERAFPSGALGGFMSLGGAIGMWLAGILVANPGIGWRGMYTIFAVPGLLFAALFWLWFRNLPAEHVGVNEAELSHITQDQTETSDGASEPIPWRHLLISPATWWICGQQFCRAAAQMFFSSWFATYLQETHEASIKQSGLYTMMPLLAIVTGTLVGGQLVDKIYQRTRSRRASRQGVACVSLVMCALFILAAFFVNGAPAAVALVTAGSFFAGTAGPCGYTIAIDMGGRHVAPLFSTMNMVGNFGAVAFIAGTPYVEQAIGWSGVMTMFCALFLMAAFCWWRLNSSGTVFEQSLLKNNTDAR
ncbi:MAG: MFS transporter [Verrucomicrobiota bacterium]|nr:MFS transporter [Verrucomicrobiota bacterium]